MTSSRRATRGNVLIVVLISLTILTLLVVSAIKFTGTNRDAARSKDGANRVSSCAEAARRYLMAQLPINPLSPNPNDINPADSTISFERVIPDSTVAAERSQMGTGHIGAAATSPTIIGISALSVGAARNQVRDLANTVAPGTLGGQYYRVVVRCIEPGTTRESELEFSFRYGI